MKYSALILTTLVLLLLCLQGCQQSSSLPSEVAVRELAVRHEVENIIGYFAAEQLRKIVDIRVVNPKMVKDGLWNYRVGITFAFDHDRYKRFTDNMNDPNVRFIYTPAEILRIKKEATHTSDIDYLLTVPVKRWPDGVWRLDFRFFMTDNENLIKNIRAGGIVPQN